MSRSEMIKKLNENNNKDDIDLYCHLDFHPKDISRKIIQQCYNETCNIKKIYNKKNNLGEKETSTSLGFKEGVNGIHNHKIVINKLTIAYHRPKNLRDHLNPSTLLLPDNNTVTRIAAAERMKYKTK